MVDVEKAVDFMCKTHTYWKLEDLASKKKIQELVFPQGVVINPDSREVLTNEVNPFYLKNPCKSIDCESAKEKSKADLEPCSHLVAELSQKPNIFRSFYAIVDCYEFIRSRHPELSEAEQVV